MDIDSSKIMNRDNSIDLLRALGLILVILAHIQPPELLFQIRSFDVVLMVFLSGMSFGLKPKNISTVKKYFDYTWKRFRKLIIPTWTILVSFFIIFYILKSIFGFEKIAFTKETYIFSFLLISGVGIVWVMRIYFCMSLLGPLLEKIPSLSLKYLFMIPVMAFGYDFLTMKLEMYDSLLVVKMFESIVIYTIGYGYCYFLGMRFNKYDKVKKFVVLFINLGIFIIFAFISGFSKISEFKYPPRVYYLTYGMVVTILLYCIANTRFVEMISKSKIVLFLSQNSLLIYLLHLFPLKMVEFDIVKIKWGGWMTRYAFVLLSAIVVTVIYNHLKNLIFIICNKKSI